MPARRRAPPARTPTPPQPASPHAMYEATTDADDTLRFTIGRVEVGPGSPNTVPGRTTFTIDMRHPDDAVLDAHEKKLKEIVAAKAAPCPASIERVVAVPPTNFDPMVVDLVRTKTNALRLSNMDIPSGAGHDAMHIAHLCPSGMIFVPLPARHQPQRGREHHPRMGGGRAARARGRRARHRRHRQGLRTP